MAQLLHTPLHSEHMTLSARMAPFSNWEMPIYYSGIIDERNHCRSSACIFDTCHMGILGFKGNIGESGIEFAMTNRIKPLPVNKCSYGFLLHENGSVIDDLIVYRMSEDELMIVINAATIDNDYNTIENALTEKKSLSCLSPALSKIDLQGPASADVLQDLFGTSLSHLTFFSFDRLTHDGVPIVVSRTGYTGELGFELYVNRDRIISLWRLILSHESVKPAGLGARDLLRMEAGLPLSGTDINETITPLEAGLDMFVHFDKDFRGKEALIQQKETGLQKKRVSFMTDSRRAPRSGNRIFINGTDAGYVTSGIFSPVKNCGIGMGYAKTALLSDSIQTIEIDIGNRKITATLTSLPFYKDGSVRKTI